MARKAVWGAGVLLAATCGMAGTAQAQSVGVYRGVFGGRDAALASADSVLGQTPMAALAWNPAGLADAESTELDLGFAAVSARGRFANRVDANGLLRDATGIVPDGAFVYPLRNRSIVVSGGMLTDGAIAGSWRYRDVPGAAGATYGLETHRSGVLVLRPTAGVAARLGSKFAVGGSVSMLWNRNELKAPYIFQTQAPLVGLKTLLDVHATGHGWGASLGAVAHPHPRVTAGLAWRSQTTLTTRGSASGDAWAQFAALGVDADASFDYAAAVRNSFPSMVAGGASVIVTPACDGGRTARALGLAQRVLQPADHADRRHQRRDQQPRRLGRDRRDRAARLEEPDRRPRRHRVSATHRRCVLRAGYAYGPSPVPTGTLTPMTAAIVEHTLGFGAGLLQGKTPARHRIPVVACD